MDTLQDRLDRPLRDLRISVIDRCNFRCTYCMPREVFGPGYDFLHGSEILSFDEITRLARIFTTLGVRKLRLTGGEPLLRGNLAGLIRQLAAECEGRDLALTTNGSRLSAQALSLREAGLNRVTVSLDALDDATFQRMNDARFPVSRVVDGIEMAVRSGFAPVKVNCVVRRGVNEHAIAELADRFSSPDYVVRFIEYMDVGNSNGWSMADLVPAREIAGRLELLGSLRPLPALYAGEVARRYQTAAGGEIGIIASVTSPFCQDCNRARLTADGKLFTCLFASAGVDLRAPLRDGASDTEISSMIRSVWSERSDRYSEVRALEAKRPKVEMSAIGG